MHDGQYSFRYQLERTQKQQPNRRKGDRTRDKLKLAAIDALSDIGYRDLKVLDICHHAKVSSGTFYLYFENKTDITQAVLEEFIAHLDTALSTQKTEKTPFETLYKSNLEWLKSIRANAGLFRTALQVGDESPELSGLIHDLNANWYKRIARNIARRHNATSSATENTILLATFGLGSMMDELARKLIIYPDPHLTALVKEMTPTDEEYAEFLSLVWYRTLYGTAPTQDLSSSVSQILADLKLD